MQSLLVAFTLAAGVLSAMQAGSNSALGKAVGQVTAGLTSLAFSAIALTALGLCIGTLAWPSPEKAAAVPWWAWFGGVMGAILISAQLFAAQQLGSAIFAGLFVTATLVASVALDHYGLMGFKQHSATWPRLAGVALMIAGVAIVSGT